VNENLQTQLALLPDALSGHLVIVVVPLALGVAVSVPLGLLAAGRPRVRGPLLAVTGLVQTVPGLALLALMVPVLVGVGQLLAPIGVAVPALGPLPVGIALTLYAMLPVVRNTVAGVEGVDPAVVDAARAVGMTPGQVRRHVELPLAAPVILAGIRTAAVWVVGMGTLATPVGQTSLGNFIFSGLQTRNALAVVVGCLGAAGLALVVDGCLALVERGARARRTPTAVSGIAGLAVLTVLGLGVPRLVAPRTGGPTVVVGAKPFTEQYVLARVVAERLRRAGFAVDLRDSLGSTVLLDGLLGGEVDVAVDYSGTLWANALHRTEPASADAVIAAVCAHLEPRARCVGPLGFENAYGLAVRRADADSRGWRTVADLAGPAPELAIGSDYEFFQRPEWAAVRDAYGLRFGAERTFDPTFLYDAVGRGDVDVVTAYTSDGRIDAFELVVLEDPRGALPPYDALLLVSAGAPAGVADALAPLVGAISVEAMRAANRQVDVDGATPDAAARSLDAALAEP
jgi:osmoprotectant transport system permease protein